MTLLAAVSILAAQLRLSLTTAKLLPLKAVHLVFLLYLLKPLAPISAHRLLPIRANCWRIEVPLAFFLNGIHPKYTAVWCCSVAFGHHLPIGFSLHIFTFCTFAFISDILPSSSTHLWYSSPAIITIALISLTTHLSALSINFITTIAAGRHGTKHRPHRHSDNSIIDDDVSAMETLALST